TSPRPVQDHEGRTDATTWAQGCRAGDGCTCADEHSARTTAARRRAADDRFPAAVRDDVLWRAARGATPKQAARAAGVTVERIWSYARSHPEWLARLDEALMAGRDPLLRHGREHTYRMGCHCPQCRAAKAALRGEKRKRPSAERAGQP
ncbi:hypothetical protein, partial [Streptomyces sp. NPDC094049]|uniref:hypothetical protein n=1 Tax=Streptomyces sp. NPDC094049 TaxID=3154987 RepID=UPI003324A2B3